MQALKRHKKGRIVGYMEAELSTEGFLTFWSLQPCFMYYVIEIMNDHCHAFSSSNHQFEKICACYTVHILMIVL